MPPENQEHIEGSKFLGKIVFIKIDRPIHSKHPKFGFVYELNYGYIPNTKAGDGKEQDVYVIGVDEKLESFEGIVKAIIIRKDDDENKLIVTPRAFNLTKETIINQTHFQEQYFDIEVLLWDDKNRKDEFNRI